LQLAKKRTQHVAAATCMSSIDQALLCPRGLAWQMSMVHAGLVHKLLCHAHTEKRENAPTTLQCQVPQRLSQWNDLHLALTARRAGMDSGTASSWSWRTSRHSPLTILNALKTRTMGATA
jgi:hypothetical protein